MSDQTYNGWTNYETWAVKLWIDNDQGCYQFWQDQARESANAAPHNCFSRDREQERRIWLAECLKSDHEEAADDLVQSQASVFTDLMMAALGSVNWHEIAQSLLDDAKEEAA